MNPTQHARPGGHDGDVPEPRGGDVPELPEPEAALRDAVLRGAVQSKLNPGQSFQYTFTRAGEYFFNDCTDPRPTGKVVAYLTPQDVPDALRFTPSTLDLRFADGVFTGVQGVVTAHFSDPGRLHARRRRSSSRRR